MSLAGLTRDSIVGLSDLIHDDDDDDVVATRVEATDGDDANGFLFIDDENDGEEDPTNLEDGRNVSFTLPQEQKETGTTTSRATGGGGKDNATANNKEVSSPTASSPGAYAGFAYDYTEYSDYYADPYAYNSGGGGGLLHGKEEKKNFFCCLLAPWKSNEEGSLASDDDDRDLVDTDSRQAEEEVDAAKTRRAAVHPEEEPDHASDNDIKSEYLTKDSLNLKKAKALGLVKDDHHDDEHEEEKKGCDLEELITVPPPPQSRPNHQQSVSNASSIDEYDVDDASSADTSAYGEKLSDKDRAAVLARLRLSDPTEVDVVTASAPDDDEEEVAGSPTGGAASASTAAAAGAGGAASTTSKASSDYGGGAGGEKKKDHHHHHKNHHHQPHGLLPSGVPSPAGNKTKSDEAASKGPSASSAKQQGASSASSPPNEAPPTMRSRIKGILKRTSVAKIHPDPTSNSKKSQSSDSLSSKEATAGSGGKPRRSLFPSYQPRPSSSPSSDELPPGSQSHTGEGEEMSSTGQRKKNNVRFAPMARVVTVTSRKEMSVIEKSQVWWQRSDYDDFKKTGRIIAKAMLEGGSSIWLQTNNAWSNRQQLRQQKLHGTHDTKSHSERSASTEYNRALRQYSGGDRQQAPGEDPNEDATEQTNDNADGSDDFGNKWWCKFGHSRRGLEHIASMDEGKQRQRSVNAAIKAVMHEQRRQRLHRTKDPNQLRALSVQFTSWARDLALAAGAADEEAVSTNFGKDAKCRTHFLLKKVVHNAAGHNVGPPNGGGGARSDQSWANPSISLSTFGITPELLDANTASSAKLRKMQTSSKSSSLPPQRSSKEDEAKSDGGDVVSPPPSPAKNDDGFEAIHDPDLSHENIAKKAKGFGGEDAVDMAAVLRMATQRNQAAPIGAR